MSLSEFRRGEIAQKTEVTGATSVDPNERSEDTPTITVLMKFAFDGSWFVGRRVVENGAEVTCSLVVCCADFLLPDLPTSPQILMLVFWSEVESCVIKSARWSAPPGLDPAVPVSSMALALTAMSGDDVVCIVLSVFTQRVST